MANLIRLKKTPEFKKVYKEGERFVGPQFVLYVLRNFTKKNRVGISIAKAHFKHATKRNRLRRVAKEIFRTKYASKLNGYDVVVASRFFNKQKVYQAAVKNLKSLLSKLDVYEDN